MSLKINGVELGYKNLNIINTYNVNADFESKEVTGAISPSGSFVLEILAETFSVSIETRDFFYNFDAVFNTIEVNDDGWIEVSLLVNGKFGTVENCLNGLNVTAH